MIYVSRYLIMLRVFSSSIRVCLAGQIICRNFEMITHYFEK